MAAPESARYNSLMTILVAGLSDLRDVQHAARDICRSLTLDGPDVFDAVIAVTEFANHHFIGPQRPGNMGLAIIRSKDSVGLEISMQDEAPVLYGGQPLRRSSLLTFPRAPDR
jgi:hypothetical protein